MKIENRTYYGIQDALRAIMNSYKIEDEKRATFLALKFFDKLNTGEAKHLEFINVSFDITATRAFLQQFATYRIGMTSYSESTMHTITKREFELSDFHITERIAEMFIRVQVIPFMNQVVRDKHLTKDEKTLILKELLPESYLQKRTVSTNLKTLLHIYNQRKSHKLQEWQDFCSEIEDLVKQIKKDLEND